METMPLAVRLILFGLLGLIVGGQINRAIYRLSWEGPPIDPWGPPHPQASERTLLDRIPILGWLLLRRDAGLFGDGFWIRPLLIEVATAAVFVGLYVWETIGLPGGVGGLAPAWLAYTDEATMRANAQQAQYLAHITLFSLLMAASWIDIDERTIPDEITIPGTLLALVIAALLPDAGLPEATLVNPKLYHTESLRLTMPVKREISQALAGEQRTPVWDERLDGPLGLALGFACYAGWVLALWNHTWWHRSGPLRLAQFLWASAWRVRPPRGERRRLHDLAPWFNLALLVLGIGGIFATWFFPAFWRSLLTALVGMAFGGGIILLIRWVGGFAVGREAMGFGDVTLMAMIGAFLGWQPALIVVFLAPVAGLAVAGVQWLVSGENETFFGPYLSLAAFTTVVAWPWLWQGYFRDLFLVLKFLGWYSGAIALGCLLFIGGLLWGMRQLRELVASEEEPEPDAE